MARVFDTGRAPRTTAEAFPDSCDMGCAITRFERRVDVDKVVTRVCIAAAAALVIILKVWG